MVRLIGVTTMGASLMAGRKTQEDRFVIETDLNKLIPGRRDGKRRLFVGVFDGHGGEECSDFLARRFHLELADHPDIVTDPAAALESVWNEMDDKFLVYQMQRSPSEKMGKRKRRKSLSGSTVFEDFHKDGSTATVCLIVDNDAYIAYIGDSCAICFKKNDTLVTFGDVHNTSNPEELKRVAESGGKLKRQGSLQDPRSIVGCLRRNNAAPVRVSPGGLLITRAFGDFHAKIEKYGGKPGVILSSFDNVHHLPIDDSVEQIVLASDGVWDAMDDTTVKATITRTAIAEQTKEAEDIYSSCVYKVLETAMESNYWDAKSTVADNCTCVLVHFHTNASEKRFGDCLRTWN